MKQQNYRPLITIPKSNGVKAMEIISIICLIAIIASAFWLYQIAPAKVPMHFDINGNVNMYGDKTELILLPCIALAIFFGLGFISNKPHLFNYLHQLNETNVAKSYKSATTVIFFLRMMVLILFVLIQYITYKAMFSQNFKLNNWFIFIPISIIVLVPIVMGIKSYKDSKS